MELPFDREKLRGWNVREQHDEIEQARAESPGRRLGLAIALSDFTLGLSAVTQPTDVHGTDIAEKARLYAAPLRALDRG